MQVNLKESHKEISDEKSFGILRELTTVKKDNAINPLLVKVKFYLLFKGSKSEIFFSFTLFYMVEIILFSFQEPPMC